MSKYPGRIVSNLAPAGYSVFFDGNTDVLSAASNAAFAFGTGDFTIEAWINPSSLTADTLLCGVDATGGAILGYSTTTVWLGSRAVSYDLTATYTIPLNTWTHIAVSRQGTTARLFANGVQIASGTVTNNYAQGQFAVGNYVTANIGVVGYLSNVRAVKGTALYTAAFNPPTQLLNITNTSILTCNSPAFVDQSSNAFSLTAAGTPFVSTFTPFRAYVPYNPALGASTPGIWTVDEAMQAAATRQWNMYDPYFNLNTLLLHGNGTNGAQNNTFLDSSNNNFTITRNGNTTQGTFSPFSQTGWSNFFTAASSQTIGFANNNAFKFGAPSGNTNDFVVEFFVYSTTTSISLPVGTGYTSGTTYWNFNLNRTAAGANTAGYVQFFLTDNFGLTATTGLNANQWNHICAVRTGTTVSLFVNGTRQATGTSSVDPNPTGSMYVGGDAFSLGRYLDGYVSNLRIIKGSTLPYDAGSSSITVPTAQLTAITGTTVLTCQSNRFIDNSSNGLAVTFTGTPSVQAFSPFYPTAAYTPQTIGGSGFFDGTGDYLTVADNPALEPVGNNFCIEISYYPTSVSGNRVLIGKRVNPSTDYGFLIFLSGATVLTYISSANSSYDIANGNNIGTLVNNQWHHIAIFRVGNAWYASLNGAITTLASNNSLSVNNNPGTWAIGADSNGGTVVQGFISNVRFVIGSSVYTSTSAPFPTAPLTAITNTSLLCNFTNAGVVDSTAKNVLETVGNAQISTAVSRFGGSSIAFDGTGDYLVTPSSPVNILGSGDFTVELWAYPSNISAGYRALVASENYNGTTGGWSIYQNGTAIEVWLTGSGSPLINATSSLTATTWQHIALSRASGTVRLFVNGISVGSASSSAEWTGQRIFIGDNNVSGTDYFFNGYIDELRITKGFARYTAAFTPQTSQWQDQ